MRKFFMSLCRFVESTRGGCVFEVPRVETSPRLGKSNTDLAFCTSADILVKHSQLKFIAKLLQAKMTLLRRKGQQMYDNNLLYYPVSD